MISRGDVRVVREEIERLGGVCRSVTIGVATLQDDMPHEILTCIREALVENGYEVLEDKTEVLIEQIKHSIIETLRLQEGREKPDFTEVLSRTLHRSYRHLSSLFSEHEETTIEQFIILQRIARVKTLLRENDLNLAEIAHRLHYSSPSHLSTQFKSISGITPTSFRQSQ